MSTPDLNLLVTLDVLLAEGSVARAARRLRLSPSAMSRALARLRETTGDPLLVRAGRGLVPTPRALELRERVGQLVQDGEAVCARPRSSSSNSWSDVHAADQRLWRTSDRTSSPALASKRPACGFASCRRPTRTARHFATGSSIWKQAS
ncbi:MAG: LysR family transcriptional regulator [Betaproteobacteria bacterium]|nr:LysR family transcriptional regulator [Betaproteobacteria bacterium]